MEIHDTCCIIVEDNEKFLIIEKAKGYLLEGRIGFPGGHVDEGETVSESAQREANEEVGEVEVEKDSFLVFIHDTHELLPNQHQHKCHCFKGKVIGKLRPGDDAGKILWMTKEELMNSEKTLGFVKIILKEKY